MHLFSDALILKRKQTNKPKNQKPQIKAVLTDEQHDFVTEWKILKN